MLLVVSLKGKFGLESRVAAEDVALEDGRVFAFVVFGFQTRLLHSLATLLHGDNQVVLRLHQSVCRGCLRMQS